MPVEVLSRSPVGTIFPDFRRVACRCLNLGKDQKDLSQRHGELIEQREAPTQMFVDRLPVDPTAGPKDRKSGRNHKQGAYSFRTRAKARGRKQSSQTSESQSESLR